MKSKWSLALALALSTTAASAQGHGGGGRGGGLGSPFPPGGRGGAGPSRPEGNLPRGTLQLGPAGRWWDDSSYVRALRLTPLQQRRMDQIFEDNRPTLVKLLSNLKQAETSLAQARSAGNLEENTLFPQIDRVAQARGELAKANAHLQLQIRREMTPEQATQLDEASQN